MNKLLYKLNNHYRHRFKQRIHSYRHCRNLVCVQDRLAAIKPRDILAVIVLRNEAARIPFFLDYYRKLGVGHFLFIDNDSTDDLMAILSAQQDCSVWNTPDSYKASNFGLYWQNHLLRRYGPGHWCLMLDPDEFLVYPHMDTRTLRELTEFLDQEGKESFFSVMLDMYGSGRVDEAHYTRGQPPLEVCPWFDASGYYQEYQPNYWNWWVRGGVRRRIFSKQAPWDAPALNKTVLVKWKPYFSYLSSAHMLWPRRLNLPHFNDGLAPTGCLLHFKYLSLIKEKVEEEMQRQQHYAGSREYITYRDGLLKGQLLWHPGSVAFSGWRQCVQLGLMNIGRWF